MKIKKRTSTHKLVLAAVGCLLFLLTSVVMPMRASAAYTEHNLVDDTIFLDAASMSQQQIQNFLNARGGYIANYYSWSDRDGGNVSAARIIWAAAYDYGINPQVILATLQKEQSLVTAKNPSSSQLNFAMGYGCPDSTGCGAKYKGFYQQVDNGAWQLRYNFERARGNNTWWRNSSSYACGGATRYYSTGLYRGNTVTFYDDYGTGYKTFKMNGAATASMYCYTPHAYPGSARQYYSGSYNFVTAFENWFGSTQPGIVVSSPIRVSATNVGVYTHTPVTVSFDLTNNTNYTMGVGQMAVAVRDAQGNNYDYGLQQMTIPPFSTIRYSASQIFETNGNYTFTIVQKSPQNVWSDSYPVSSSIDNPRSTTVNVKPMPIVTGTQSLNVTDMRVGKSATYSFTVRNPSNTTALNVGKIALAVRGPNSENYDLALKPVTIAAGGTYTYTESFTPQKTGTYRSTIIATTDDGASWGDWRYPLAGDGASRDATFSVKTNPTLTAGPALSIGTPRVGQPVNATFKVRNYADNSVNMGKLALAIRDPLGRNVDPAPATVTINGDSEYTFAANNMKFTMPGRYTAVVTGTDGTRWYDDSFPVSENGSVKRSIEFIVEPSPTLTVQPHITTSDPRVGKAITASFTLHNYGDTDVNLGKMALAARDPRGRNVDFELKDVVVPAGGDYVYTATNPGASLQQDGTYSMVIIRTQNNGATWDDSNYAAIESASIKRSVTFDVKKSPTLTAGPTLSVPSPHVGQSVTMTFKVKNHGDQAINMGKLALAIRDPLGRNVDPAPATVTINGNTEYTFQATMSFATAGVYTAFVTGTDGVRWYDDTFPASESNAIQRTIQFTVQP